MAEAPTKGPQLLKVWDNWEAGVGYLRDDGRTPGMYTASAVLGMRGELRPAPLMTEVDLTGESYTAGMNYGSFFEEDGGTAGKFLYVVASTLDTAFTTKIDLNNATFGTVQETIAQHTAVTDIDYFIGQPARYKGNWYIPTFDVTAANMVARKLTTVGDPPTGDTWNSGEAATGANHYAMMNHQLVRGTFVADGARAYAGDTGVSILKVDGDPTVEADWYDHFPVGDSDESINAIAAVGGLMYVYNEEGVYSFNDQSRSSNVYRDIAYWPASTRNAPMVPWRDGLLVSHPSGLLFIRPWQQPVNVGPTGRGAFGSSPPPGPTELSAGYYHGIAVAGSWLYVIYQPDITADGALVLAGSPINPENPLVLNWQVLGPCEPGDLKNPSSEVSPGIFVAKKGHPTHTSQTQPSVWFQNTSTLAHAVDYVTLAPDSSPFRPRHDTHKVATSGSAYMSEIFFPTPHRLSHLVVHTQDMTSGDEWQLTGIANADDTERKYGLPVIINGRDERVVAAENVSRFMLRTGWTATSAAARAAPAIKRIELFGWPS